MLAHEAVYDEVVQRLGLRRAFRDDDDALVQSEIFGPVITVQAFRGDDDALTLANGVEQGLTASV